MSHQTSDSLSPSPHSQRTAFTYKSGEPRMVRTGLLVFVGYYLGARLGFALTFQPHPISVFWPPNSVLLAALLLTPPRIWWFLLLGAFPAHLIAELQSHVPPAMVVCWFISNCCEALIGAGLIRYFLRDRIRFDTLSDVAIFCICGAFLAPFLSSFIDAEFVKLNRWGQDSYFEIWRVRFFSNSLTALTLVPAIVTWYDFRPAQWRGISSARALEGSALFLGLVIASTVVLYNASTNPDPVLFYAPMPFLLWAVFRFGNRATSAGVLIVTFLAIWSSAHGHGPFTNESAEINARSIQLFLIVIAVPIMLLAAGIQERAVGETKLRESESRFRIVADAAPVLIWMSGVDKLYTFFNKPWLEFTGRSMEQELGNGWAQGVHPEDLQRCLKMYTEAFDARESFVMQYRLRRNDGEYRWVSDQGVARYDEHGKFAGYIGTAVDVTELINKDAALRESEERMRLAADAVNLGIWELDLSTEEIWATNSRRALLGWPASGKIGFDDFISCVHPDDRNRIQEAIDDAINKHKDYDSEYRLVLPDGVVRWMATRGSLHLSASGRPTRLLGVSIDITARKQAELETKQQRDELSHLSRVAAMGELAASIAHELNQPLAGITSNASAGQRFIDRGDVDLRELHDLLGDIMTDGRRAGAVLRGIQSMVKKGIPTRQRVNLNDLVMNVARIVNPNAMLQSCEVETSLEPDLPPIEADPIQLQQVLLNLVINSFDAMRDTPLSRRKVVIVTERNADDSIRASVRDYGVGISEESRDRLFDHFFTTKAQGLGMGLAIVRSIVQSHGGTIAAENAEGGGARFYFALPAKPESLV